MIRFSDIRYKAGNKKKLSFYNFQTKEKCKESVELQEAFVGIRGDFLLDSYFWSLQRKKSLTDAKKEERRKKKKRKKPKRRGSRIKRKKRRREKN